MVLRKFNKNTVGDVAQNYISAKDNYQAAQLSLQSNPHSAELQREEMLAGKIFAYYARTYENFLRQKSKVNWIRYGDDNTTYFYACLKQIRAANCITPVVAESGQLIERFDDVVAHFRKIMGSPSNASVPIQQSCFKLGHRLRLDQQIGLAKVLPSLINQNQGVFVKNRLLAHNILILQDIIKGYKRKNISPRCVMNIDLSKAYDMLDWHFFGGHPHCVLFSSQVYQVGDDLFEGPFLFDPNEWLLCQASMNKSFRYHPKCKPLKIVNLCFADDLVLFCKGVSNPVQILKDHFTEFCLAYGLSANMEKSQVYFGGLADREVHQLLDKLRFSEGCFPLKYLGVPLRTTKWKAGDCAIIIKKIQLKLHIWASRHLSFAGRAQLINSVLLSISKMHLTAWDQVCLPMCMGGLGFKEGLNWNKVLLAKFVWAVSFKQDILWVKWVDSIYLKGQDFWAYKIPQDVSWYWKKIVNLRAVFPSKNLEEAVKNNKICLRDLYNRLLNKDRVTFANVVWCSLTLPKHRFILWQATLGHLLTRDKLHYYEMKLSSLLCPVCEEEQESHSHLFFACPFSHQVKAKLEDWLGRDLWPSMYDNWCSWMVGKPKGLKQQIVGATIAATVYMVWRNRNNCIFELSSLSVGYVVQMIKYYL
ncbi:uncharacterized protein LOC133824364 [Humulus lupulus]|uniref:uncharacterized protein LOC133824364 n=1 Tax=Humulus lupulus TaxID=3486 RepID=UPI002B411ED8|nr:uncharacterized protein LOC133824364 [Humulus lupulus]